MSWSAAVRRRVVLLLVINRTEQPGGIIPGKLYEYLAPGRPVLGLGPPDGDAAEVHEAEVRKATGAGCVFAYDDVEDVSAFFNEHHAAFRAGTPREGTSAEAAAPYSRRGQTSALADVLDAL